MTLYQIEAVLSTPDRDGIDVFRVEADSDSQARSKAVESLKWSDPLLFPHYRVCVSPLERSQSWRVVFADADTDGDEEIAFSVLAYDADDAIGLARKEAREQPCLNVGLFLDARRVRGGRRPGAGRPATENKKPKTVVKRVPVEMADKLEQIDSLLHLIEDWKERAATAPETSPRWDRAREMLAEISEVLGA